MKKLIQQATVVIAALALMTTGLMLAGCGGSGGVSSQVVSGNASVGAPLAGQVSLKDSSTPPQQKTAVIGSDGSFAFDVTGLKAPFILQGVGNAAGTTYKLQSFADGTGTANVNPLSNAVVAIAAGIGDPEQLFLGPSSDMLQKIKAGLPAATSDLLNKLQPLLKLYSADGKDPIRDHYGADQQGLDGLFDNVTVTIPNGVITVTNTKTGATIFSAPVSDIKNGQFNADPASLPQPPALPAAPGEFVAVGGAGQVALSWKAIANATSYNIYYATTSGVTSASETKIANVTSPYVKSGLATGTTYYFVVTAVNSAGESTASAQASAATATAPPALAIPAAPANVIATGGTKQVTLSWNTVSTANSYNVYYGTASGVTKGNGTKIAAVSSPAVLTGLTAATTYYYIVTAINGTGEGAASIQVAAGTLNSTPSPVAPAVPASITAVGGIKQVSLSWSAASGASTYNVYWSTTPGITTAKGTKIAGVTSPYVKTGLSAGSSYYFIVTAVSSAGESATSAQVMASTNPPPASKKLPLAWDAVAGATSYSLYWSTSPGVTPSTGKKISGVSSPYDHTGLSAGTTYYYVVTANNGVQESAASTQASGTTTL